MGRCRGRLRPCPGGEQRAAEQGSRNSSARSPRSGTRRRGAGAGRAWADAGEVEERRRISNAPWPGGRTAAASPPASPPCTRPTRRWGSCAASSMTFSADYDTRMRRQARLPRAGNPSRACPHGQRRAAAEGGDTRSRLRHGLAAPAFRPFATSLRQHRPQPADDSAGRDERPLRHARGRRHRGLALRNTQALRPRRRRRRLRLSGRPVARVRRRAPCPASGSTLLFTTERHEGEAPFLLQETRRYAHGEAYLRQLAAASGFDVRGLVHCTPRYNAGRAGYRPRSGGADADVSVCCFPVREKSPVNWRNAWAYCHFRQPCAC